MVKVFVNWLNWIGTLSTSVGGFFVGKHHALQDIARLREAQGQCRAFGRATPSPRPSIDLLYNIEQIIDPSRPTKALAQFG